MRLIQIAEDFWNIRGSFRIGGLLDIGTQASLLRCADGRFVFLDSLSLAPDIMQQVEALTDGGKALAAVINLHPFHTVHVRAMHAAFPASRHYGTQRHLDKFPDLPWAPQTSESAEAQAEFSAALDFSVPAGVDFIPANPNLHFSSVLAYHRSSGTLHVDDTLIYARLPGPLKHLGSRLAFHPTLARTLEKRAGAAADFRQWAKDLIEGWQDAKTLCAAHTHAWDGHNAAPLMQRVAKALDSVEKTLRRHERRYG